MLILASSGAFCANAIMGRYDPQQTSCTTEKLDPPLILNWEFTANKYANNPAAPVVADGVCYFASGDRVYAIDMETGTMKWKYPNDLGLASSVKATPAVYDGRVYFGAGDGNLYCIDAQTGTFNWAYQTRGSVRTPPVIVTDPSPALFFGSDDNSLYTIDAATGDIGWKPLTFRDDIANGIAIGSGMAVVACMDGNLYGVNASSGKARWPFRLPSAPVKTSPVMTENMTIMAVGNVVYGLTTRSGQKKWMIQLPSDVDATPAINATDVFIVCNNKKLYCYNIAGRQPVSRWTEPAELSGIPMSSPTVADQLVYVTTSHGVVSAFSVADGSLKWRYVCAPSPTNTPGVTYTNASSSPVISNGALVVLTDDGVLHCFTQTAPDNTPPEAYFLTPANGVRMSGAPPIKISAVLYDVGSGVDFSSVNLSLDGQPLEVKTDYTTGTVSYETPVGEPGKPVKPLKDGMRKIILTAKDYAGNMLTKEWYFIADSTMPPPRRTKVEVQEGKSSKEPVRRGNSSSGNNGNVSSDNTPPPPPPAPGPGAPGDYGNYGGRRHHRGDYNNQAGPPGGF